MGVSFDALSGDWKARRPGQQEPEPLRTEARSLGRLAPDDAAGAPHVLLHLLLAIRAVFPPEHA